MDKVYKINGHEVQFYCNEENRIVKASIGGCRIDVFEALRDDFGIEIDWWSKCATAERILDRVRMIGNMACVAHCHPDDTFDVERGKSVAYKKLRKKYWSKYAKRMFNLGNILVAASTHCVKDAQKAYERADKVVI